MLMPRPLGTTGILVSPLGLGTVKLGRDRAVKYPQPFQIPDDAAAAELLRACQKVGITLIDTAPAYGEAEERLGRIIPSCGGRHRWTIITKAGESFDPETGVSIYDFSPQSIRTSVEASLARLKIQRLDGVLLHSDGQDEWILRESGALGMLTNLKKKGMIRATGISTKTAAGALEAAALGPAGGCDILMLTLNAQEQADLPAIRAAHANGVGVLIKKALASGHEPAPDAIARCFAEPGVSSIIIGTINPAHIAENAQHTEAILSQLDA